MSNPEPASTTPSDTPALVLGILAVILGVLPVAGLPLGICGLMLGLRSRRRKARVAVLLSGVGILLAIASAAAGLYLGLQVPRPA